MNSIKAFHPEIYFGILAKILTQQAMKYFRRGSWFYLNQGQQQEMLGRIQFQLSNHSLSPVSNESGSIIGVFDILDSTFKPASENNYYKTGCDPF
jgi:hypothetical protein